MFDLRVVSVQCNIEEGARSFTASRVDRESGKLFFVGFLLCVYCHGFCCCCELQALEFAGTSSEAFAVFYVPGLRTVMFGEATACPDPLLYSRTRVTPG